MHNAMGSNYLYPFVSMIQDTWLPVILHCLVDHLVYYSTPE